MQDQPTCVEAYGLNRGQIAAFKFHGNLVMKPVSLKASCPWLIVDKDAAKSLPEVADLTQWTQHSTMRHPADHNEDVVIYKRKTQP
jgi:hypothetical protein